MTRLFAFLRSLRDLLRTRAAQEMSREVLRDLSVAATVGACFLVFWSEASLDTRRLARAVILGVSALVAATCSALLSGGPKA